MWVRIEKIDITWASRCLTVSANGLFVQQLDQVSKEKASKLHTLLALCEGNPLLNGGSPHRGPVMKKASPDYDVIKLTRACIPRSTCGVTEWWSLIRSQRNVNNTSTERLGTIHWKTHTFYQHNSVHKHIIKFDVLMVNDDHAILIISQWSSHYKFWCHIKGSDEDLKFIHFSRCAFHPILILLVNELMLGLFKILQFAILKERWAYLYPSLY